MVRINFFIKKKVYIYIYFLAYQCYPNRGAQFKINFSNDNRLLLTGFAKTIIKGTIEY